MKEKTKAVWELIFIILFLLVSSYLVQKNIVSIKEIMGTGHFGMLIYLFLIITAVVIAPISTVPLIPLASNIWGWELTTLLNVIGWTTGSMIAFFISRRYGIKLISKFISIKKIQKIENLVPKRNVFWSIVFLRMSIPVDILSYALGLFSKISTKKYFLATLIGVTPFAFLLSYVGTVPFYYQILALLTATIIIVLGFLVRKFKKNKPLKRI